MKRPIIVAAVLLAAISLILLNVNYRFSILFAALFFSATVVCAFYKSFREYTVIAVCLLLLCLSFYNTYTARINTCKNLYKDEATVTGVVTDSSYRYEDTVLYYVEITDSTIPQAIGTTALLYGYNLSAGQGMTVKMDVRLSFIEDSYSFYSNDIYLKGYVDKVHSVKDLPSTKNFLGKLRKNIRNIIFKNLPYDIATTINGLTVGDRSYEEDSFYTAVKNCGVTHVMVVSGMHMAIVCGSFYQLLKFLKCPSLVASFSTLTVTLAFMALCGFSPSVIRSGVMYIIMLVGYLLHRQPDALNSLSVAFVIMMINNPFLIYNVGFLLSVTSTAGIIVLNPLLLKLIRIDKWKIKPLRIIAELATVTISAQLATLPICLYYFGWISPWAILVNILISHAVTVAVVSAFIGIILFAVPFFQPLSDLSFKICSFMTAYFNNIIMFFGKL